MFGRKTATSGSTPQEANIFFAKTSMTTNIAGTNADITWDTEVRKDTGYTHTAGSSEVTINFTGWLEVSFITGINEASNRVELTQKIYHDTGSGFVALSDTASDYVARDGSGQTKGCIELTTMFEVTTGDKLKFNTVSEVDGGASRMDSTQTRIILKEL